MWTIWLAFALAADLEVDVDVPVWDVPVRFEAGPLFMRPGAPEFGTALPGQAPGDRRVRPLGIALFTTAIVAGALVSVPVAAGLGAVTKVY